MARLLRCAPLAAVLISVLMWCCVAESKPFLSMHAKHSTAAFSHGLQLHRISRRQRTPLGAARNAWHVSSYRGRKSVVCHSSVLDPVITSTSVVQRVVSRGVTTFMSNWKAYSVIPFIAGFVGWFTNYLAVQMIFYPIRWRGIPIYRVEGEPLGLLGWQGIVPAKTLKMSEAMVNTTINELLTMEEIIQRLDPDTVADILLPSSGQIVQPFVDELLADKPKQIQNFASTYAADSEGWIQKKVGHKFLRDLTVDVQRNIGKICNLRSCVVDMMMSDRALLGKLFQVSGKDELAFLTDSGLWFGFLLGLIQLAVALYWENPWTLSIGGLIVGLATNWLALKWIFEPVNPLKIGPIVLQGLFLRRQDEVSADFSKFFATRVLTSRQLWSSMLTDPTTLPEWEALLANRFAIFAKDSTFGAVDLESKSRKLKAASARVCANLFNYLTNLHEYVDDVLEIEQTLRARMSAMTSAQFERVLHPIFEEDELTLILAGGGLGFLAGFIQQLFSTGALTFPQFSFGSQTRLISSIGSIIGVYVLSIALKPEKSLLTFMKRLIERTQRLNKRTRRLVLRQKPPPTPAEN
ncbi:hypothetical protein HJC23_005618 [Cyclotella cryptica]|uniref:Uncharacterized protein n=1 Tax=Cyclotella cryptica TaxID=29204 RepID=A0ABD3Q0T2_9STRA|eukprot:CCRYP_010477-RA/>CCRYP_010477-RA protein AED:0.04 eAED:0.04 QI:147/1/1/1/1/1/3/55/578